MAETIKVLGQEAPAVTTLTDLYTVPGGKSVTASSIVICNPNGIAIKFRVSVAVGGAADTTKQYLYYDTSLSKNNTFIATIGITLDASDVVRVYTDTSGVAFNLFGVEVT